MELLTRDNIQLDIEATTKEQALAFIADLAVKRGYSADAAGVLEGLKERESQLSTSLMSGIAIPHTRHASVEAPAVLVVRLASSVDWTDDNVHVLIAMLVPDGGDNTTHLQLLAQVSRALIEDDVQRAVIEGTADEIYSELAERLN